MTETETEAVSGYCYGSSEVLQGPVFKQDRPDPYRVPADRSGLVRNVILLLLAVRAHTHKSKVFMNNRPLVERAVCGATRVVKRA